MVSLYADEDFIQLSRRAVIASALAQSVVVSITAKTVMQDRMKKCRRRY